MLDNNRIIQKIVTRCYNFQDKTQLRSQYCVIETDYETY